MNRHTLEKSETLDRDVVTLLDKDFPISWRMVPHFDTKPCFSASVTFTDAEKLPNGGTA